MRKPRNVAGVVGEDVALNCTYDVDMNPLTGWMEYISNPSGQYIFVGDTSSNPPNPEIYSLSKPEPGDYDLIINLLDTSGALYSCMTLVPYHSEYFVNVIVFSKFSDLLTLLML